MGYLQKMKPALTIYYNTHCPVCTAGISYQQRKLVALVRVGVVAFADINLQPDVLKSYGATLEDIRRRLHAVKAGGRLIVGADVMVALWRVTSGQWWLAVALGHPLTLPVTRFFYNRFADLLYSWNRGMGHW
jgi:predicted DCC family thiol-disulfide oxidoreductase YuxK